MNPSTSTTRPAKRRRTKAFRRVTEDDDDMADGIIVKTTMKESASGTVEERIEVPVWCDKKQETSTTDSNITQPHTQPLDTTVNDNAVGPDEFYSNNSSNEETRGPTKTQAYYIQQFVDRIHPMIRALLSREALPRSHICDRCTGNKFAVWRCRDCTAARILCRGCIRNCHMDCPTHRIEVWCGEYFRHAELWEVGLYILVRHHTDPFMCATLQFQNNILGDFQREIDDCEQKKLKEGLLDSRRDLGRDKGNRPSAGPNDNDKEDIDMPPKDHMEDTEETFSQFIGRMDDLYKKSYEADGSSGGDDEHVVDIDAGYPDDEIEDMPCLPDEYIPMNDATAAPAFSVPSTEIPRVDALNNPYVRVVHTNGVHHIGLVYCTCRGRENTHEDLMAAGLVPTSFTRYKTIFTHGVLDDFRITNLECKASAYQYFQKLRRQTSPMSPDNVPNLYHELRRMSRLWRWTKKLKWAGMAHRTNFTIDPKPGELANFCPACPQPGINLPENWWTESER